MNERDIFIAARNIASATERSAYLAQICGTDIDLRQNVLGLLQAHEEAGSFLGTQCLESTPTDSAASMPEASGTIIGPYKLLQQIGEGGMGVVFMAEQYEPVRRCVALKIIKPGMNTREVVARFEAERQALALMDHPNIAKVLDVGTTEFGHPFFVMELIKGQPITKYCDEHRLTPKERLKLFIPVCQAIQHAHQKGVIHRDIKPSNVLIAPYDSQPIVKVIDFGVAKATGQRLSERTLFTQFGAMVGTLEYMSPEQAELNNRDIDTRSDLYSLGVLLYELLTGATPLDRARLTQLAFDEILRIIREDEPLKPSTRLSDSVETLPAISAQRQTEPAKLTRLMRGELDWIVMKALDKDRNLRYETANDFALDVQRYLADEPVQACPPSRSYRAQKFVRRNRGALTTAVLLVVALLAGSGVSIWQATRATLAQKEAEENSRAALAQKERAELHLREAQDLVAILSEVGHRTLRPIPGTRPVQRELIEKALTYFQKYQEQEKPDRMMRHEIASAYYRAGMIRHEQGETAPAFDAYRTAEKLFTELSTEFPAEPLHRHEVTNTLRQLLPFYTDRSEEKQAVTRCLEIRRQLASEFPDHPIFGTDSLASFYSIYANTLMRSQDAFDLGEAEKVLRLALETQFSAAADHTDVINEMKVALSSTLWKNGRHKESIEIEEQIVTKCREYLALNPNKPLVREHLAGTLKELVSHLTTVSEVATSNPTSVEEYAKQAVEILRQLLKEFPDRSDYRVSLISCNLTYAGILLANPVAANLAVAEQAAREAAELSEKISDQLHRQMILHECGGILLRSGQVGEAEQIVRLAIEICQTLKNDSPLVLDYHGELALRQYDLGTVLETAGRLQEAELAHRASLEIQENLLARFPNQPGHSARENLFRTNLNNILWRNGKFQESIEHSEKLAATYLEALAVKADEPTAKQNAAQALNIVAWKLATAPDVAARNTSRAVTCGKQAVELVPQAMIWNTLGVAYYRAGEWNSAIEALENSEKLQPGGYPGFNGFFLALAHHQLGHEEEARKWYDLACAWTEKNQAQNEELLRFRNEAMEVLGPARE